jgi:Bifunctional DNA primase/polymerase, N-terminal
VTDDDTLRQALAYAARGWPVFPCQPGRKIPATWHGYLDATTNPDRISAWFSRLPRWNVAIATGTPGPDVLDVDQHGPAGNGFAALKRLGKAGLLDGANACVRTPGGGLHLYFTGSHQRNGHLAGQHVDFRSEGGYILAPPSRIDGKPYRLVRTLDGQGSLDWAAVTKLLEPQREQHRPGSRQAMDRDLNHLARWLARQPEGNRNAGLFWAAHRALDANPAADLKLLADAARQAGLTDQEITRTLDSAHKRREANPFPPDRDAEAG